MVNYSHKIVEKLPQKLLQLLRDAGMMADKKGESVYLVGGAVRDLLLDHSNLDIDLVVEGRAISLARRVANINEMKVKTHPRFGTAKILWGEFDIDFVTARSETYNSPGSLPEVKSGTIQDDLARRDFTINSMALSLVPDSFGELLDFHEGQDDLKKKLIRILHQQSFVDDPTRILRALRYEQRLGFSLEHGTEESIRQNLNSLDTITGERIWRELELILQEEIPERVLSRVEDLGVLQKLCTQFKAGKWLEDKFEKARDMGDDSLSLPVVYLALLFYQFDNEDALGSRLKIPGWAVRVLRDTMKLKKLIPELEAVTLKSSDIYFKLEKNIPEVIAAVACASESAIGKKRMMLYLNKLRYVTISLNGDDLQKMGIVPGRKMGRILKALREARINGIVSTCTEEENLVKQLL